jgi:hypothetical protein
MGIEECRVELRKIFDKDELPERELNRILTEADAIKADNPLNFNDIVGKLAQERVLELKEQAANHLLTTERIENLKSYMARMKEEDFNIFKRKLGMDNQNVAKLEAMLAGRGTDGFGSNLNVDSIQSALHGKLNGPIESFLKLNDVRPETITSREFGLDVMRELYHLNASEKGFATQNKLAQELAKIYKDTFKDIRDLFSSVGLDVAYNKNYAGLRRYDWEKVANDKKGFIDFLMSDQMHPNTFEPGANADQKLARAKQAWEHIVKGSSADFTKHRSLYFADADAEFNFMDKFGYFDNHFENVQAQIKTSAKLAGLMQVFGPDYKTTFDRLLEYADPAKKSKIVRHMFDDLSGQLTADHETTVTKLTAGMRSFVSLAKLPNAVISAFAPDHATAAALIGAVDGRGLLPAFNETMANYFKAADSKGRQLLAETMMLNSFDLVSHYSDGAAVGMNGKLTKAVTAMFKYTGLTGHSEMMRTSVATSIGRILAEYADKEYKDLSPQVLKTFERYTINEADWNIIRNSKMEVEGITLLSPKRAFDAAVEKKSDAVRAALKFGTMVNDHAKLVTLESNAYSRQQLLFGTKEGSGAGEVLRFISQFKQAGINVMRVQGRLSHSYDRAAYAAAVGIFGLAGYMTTVARDVLVNGRTPEAPDMNTPEGKGRMFIMALESLNRGAGGLLGDTLIAEYDKSYRSLPADLAGPVAGQLGQVAKLMAAAPRLELPQHKQEAVNIIQGLIPGANAMLIKPVLEGVVTDNIHNMLNSSYEINTRRKLRQRGQKRIKDLVFD